MTGGLGFTTLMRSISQTNRSFLKHPEKVRAKKDSLTYLTDKSRLKYKKISDEELTKFKLKLKAEKQQERKKEILIILIVATIMGSILSMAFVYLMQ